MPGLCGTKEKRGERRGTQGWPWYQQGDRTPMLLSSHPRTGYRIQEESRSPVADPCKHQT